MESISRYPLVCMYLGLIHVSAQIVHFPETITPAMDNINQLETKISLDRSVYAPREEMRVTFAVRNPTTAPLEIPNPFVKLRAGFDIMRKDASLPFPNEEGFAFTTDHPYSRFLPRDTTPNLTLQPGQSIERSVSSREVTEDSSFKIGDAPYTPGDYRIFYSYDTRTFVSFQVANPVFEQLQTGRMRQPAGEREKWVNAFVLIVDGRRLIMKNESWSNPTARIRLKPETLFSDLLRLSPYVRVAETSGQITDLAIVDGSNYATAIRWRDSTGRIVERAVSSDAPKPR